MTLANTPSLHNETARAFLRDAIHGLTGARKSLPPKWLYDHAGSALFEEITGLPEYYPTRTEISILRAHAANLAGYISEGGALVELGSGASIKTRLLLDAGPHIAAYVPIDISAAFLHATADDLHTRYPHLAVHPTVGDFANPIALPAALHDLPKVGFFPGSTIGNLDPLDAIALLVRARAWPGIETFILGADLVKDPQVLIDAYDDKAGVTARFITNILTRMNAELGADFDVDRFDYIAEWNADAAQIQMSLMAQVDHHVSLGGQDIRFANQESIAVSQSRKYTMDSLENLADAAGWAVHEVVTDPETNFAVAVLKAQSPV
ncbi:L-histidine N(alpha)-methyltransferase [uncultured Tateyamaria sp.]|uniref:L-histidine N(alpha)-methyltransferase n=1 Tax=uncultured Tateyamaria sp. TaxID=455651 RepID=UPI002629B707|nr:L-histidine N(alpha)-methyltransferase [uncultured Tateyamaria sp.]